MCMMSVLHQYADTRVPRQNWDADAFAQFQQIQRQIEMLDAKLGEPDCEDPAKAAWMREVEGRLRNLESKP